jgi:hypothetical protein
MSKQMIMLDLSNEAFSKAGLLATKYGVTAKALLVHVIEAWVSGEPMEPPEPEIHNRELRCLQIINGSAAPMTKAQVLTLLGCAPVTCQSVLLRLIHSAARCSATPWTRAAAPRTSTASRRAVTS